MAFDDLLARMNLLFSQMEHQPEDAHELLEQVRTELNQLKATGQPLPEDLARLEARLEEEFSKSAGGGKE